MSSTKHGNAFLLGAALLTLAACGGEKAEHKQQAQAAPVAVRVAQSAQRTLAGEYAATGTVKARTTTVLSARVMGYIRELRVQAGDAVKAGQVVAVLDAKETESALRQAEAARREAQGMQPEIANAIAAAQAQLDLATATYKRMQSLMEQKSITSQEFDEASARYRLAQAGLEIAKAKKGQLDQRIRQADEAVAQASLMQGYSSVVAPFAGTVLERKAEPGTLAAPGMPLVVLEQAGTYRLEANVEESRLGKIRVGQSVQVELDASPQPVAARVEEIMPSLDASSRTFTVKIGLPAMAAIRSGMFGRARFADADRQALTVPQTAVQESGQVRKVYVVSGGVARLRLVSVGAAANGEMEVLSGLSAGETVVNPVPATLTDGAKVEVR
jgi:RND family efflux transporter MFP subunit